MGDPDFKEDRGVRDGQDVQINGFDEPGNVI